MAKCEYKYKTFKNKKCPYEALLGSGYCIWHKQEDGKNFSGRDIKETDLIEAYLVKANLKETTFKKGVHLGSAHLQGADLRHAHLQGADLWDANLQGARLTGTDFTNASFNRGTDLRGAFLYTNIKDAKNFQYSKISKSKKCIEEAIADRLDKILTNKKEPNHLKVVLEPECENLGFDRDEFADFMINKNIRISEERTLLEILQPDNEVSTSEKLGIKKILYEHAKDIYISLKSYFKNVGLYEESGTFFIGEFRVRGKIYKVDGNINAYLLGSKIKNFFQKFASWKQRKLKGTITNGAKDIPEGNVKETKDKNAAYLFGSMLKNYFNFSINRLIYYISSYGESIIKVLLTALLIIFAYAGFYSLKGGVTGQGMLHPTHNFLTSLYFSIVTFTTLGYGDLHPVSSIGMRLLAGSEAFLGAFILAYFVVVVSRRIMR